MAVYDVFKSLGTESFIDMDTGAESSDCFCELCSLDFATHRELEEHTWSILHNTNLNRKQGKDCIHPCSLCKEQFTGLLEFTSHLHGENHHEKLHNWQKDQQREWSPEKQELHSPNEKQIQSPCHKGKDRPPSDLATDNLSGAKDFQDSTSVQSEESAMGDNHWGSGRGRVSSRNIPSLLDDLPSVGYHYPEQLEMRRGSPPNQPWESERWEDERGYSNDGHPMWDGRQRETFREFRDSPWYNPVLEGMDDPRYHRNRDDDRYYSSRDYPRPYPNDHFSDGYAPGPRQRDSFEGDSGFQPRYDNYRPDLRDRITRRNSNSSHPTHHNNTPQKLKSMVGTYSRGSRPEGRGRSSQRHTSHCREVKGRRTSMETTKRDYRDKSQTKNSPSSESPSGKSARKSKPRKLVRSEEKKKDDSKSGDAGTKGNELERKKREDTARREKGKSVSASPSRSVATDEKSKSTGDKSNMQPSYSVNEGTASSIKPMADPKENTSSSSNSSASSSTKRNSLSSVNKAPSPPGKKGSMAACKKDSSSPTKGDPPLMKRNYASPSERDSSSASKRNSSSSTPPSYTKDFTSLAKGESSLSVKGDLSSSDKGDNTLSIKGDFSSTVQSNSFLTGYGESSLTIKENSSLSKGSEASLARGGSSSVPSLGGSSLITAKEKEDPGKASTLQRDSSSSLKDKDKLTAVSSKREGELILPFAEKETLVALLDDKNMLSQEGVDTLSVLSDQSKDMPLPKMGDVSLPSAGERNDQTLSASSFSRETSSSLGTNGKEKRADNQAANISGESEQNNLTSSSAASAFVGSLPWGKREEELRALLGIKKEPKAEESQVGNTPRFWPKSNQVSQESQTNRATSSSSILSTVYSLTSGSNKSSSSSSRYVPVVAQLSLSRPQCSFVHIDGVQCGAVTWNKYCSYHQRVFNSEETSAHEQSLVSEGSQLARTDSSESSKSPRGIGRPGISQIFKPTSPPFDPPKRFGVDGRLDAISGVKTDQSLLSQNKNDRQLEGQKESGRENEEIDLNSTVSYKALGAAGGPHRNIDLSTTGRGATRSLQLTTDVTSEPRIDLSSTVSKLGRTLEPHGAALDGVKIDQGIDLSGTVPNLEELLALHGSSADKSSGPKFDPSKPVLKHGRSLNHQSSSVDRGPNIDLGATLPYRAGPRHLSGSSVASDNAPSIDLNETVSQPGRSRTPLDTDLKDGHTANVERFVGQPATARDGIPHFKDDVSLKRPLTTRPHRESTSASPTPNIKTEMIDLNFSTKLLGVPHSVVAPFNTSVPSPKKPTREITKSPSEVSATSCISASSRNYAPSLPQNRRVSTSPMAGEQSPASTISLPNLSLDLSRLNLPPAVRKALAERYSGRKLSSASSGQSAEFPEGRRSQPLFTDHTRNEAIPSEQGKKLSPLPARLRGRGQRSVSLDSPLIRRDNLRGEDSPRSGLLERGNIYDTNHFLSPPIRQTSEEHNQTGLSASERVSEGLVMGSNNVPLTSVPSTFKPAQDNSNELQSRGLIDLSSTSYLQRLSVPPSIQGRPTETTRTTIDNSRSPARPSVLQSRGLIDLNTTSPDFGSRDIALETPETFSVVKRKRVNSFEGSETSSLGAETLVKRLKQDEASARDTVVTYRSGINVQQLLTIERDEQDQLQNLHKVQSRLKSVRAQIQKLCTELDSLSSEEQRITLKMGELRNLRLNILENACYDRQEQVARLETVTRESSTSTVDDNRTVPVSGKPVEGESLEYDHRKLDTHRNSSSPPTRSHNVTSSATERNDHATSQATERNDHVISRATERNDHITSRETECNDGYHADDTEEEKMATECDDGSTSQGGGYSTEEPLSTSRSTDPMLESSVSVETAPKFVSRDQRLHNYQPREKEKQDVASKRVPPRRASYNDVDLNRGTNNVVQASRASISENTTSRELAAHQDNDPSSFDGGSERRFASVPETSGEPGAQKQNDSSRGKETRKDFMKKMKNVHLLEKGSQRKKSFSDENVSKTIEASRKKIQSTRENLKRWREQELGVDLLWSNEDQKKKHGSSSSTESLENSLEESGPSPVKIPVRVKTSNRKTTKELKKSSLFHSGKKAFKEERKNRVDKSHWKDKEKFKQTEAVPSKRREIDNTLCNKPCSVSSKEKTSANEKAQVVSAAAHTTTTDLGGSGTEERSSAEDEIPTRDVDVQSGNTSSNTSLRTRHLQIPSSTVESLKKNMQNSREGRQHRGPLPNKFSGHTGPVCGLKVHNGHLFTCSADKTTRSFNIQTGQCVKVFHGHHLGVNCIEVSVDMDRLFTGSNDQTARSYNIKSGVCTHNFKLDGRAMCLHAAFDRLFVGLSTGVVASIDLLTNKCLERLHCHEPSGVSCLTTATEGQRKLLCSGSFDSTIAIRDCKSGLLLRTFSDHNMTVLCLQVVENILYSGSADMKVQAHNLNSGELLRSFDGHTMSVSGLQVVGSVLVTSCLDKLIRCYDLVTAELLQVYGGQMDMIFSVHVNNGRIYSGARDGSVVSSKLDLRVYHPCKWRECKLNFGVVSHLKSHIRDYHVMEQGTVEACHWADCGHQFSTDDDISVVLRHVLGHVVTRTARKSAA